MEANTAQDQRYGNDLAQVERLNRLVQGIEGLFRRPLMSFRKAHLCPALPQVAAQLSVPACAAIPGGAP